MTEVGLFARVGAAAEILLAYWTKEGDVLAAATPGVTLVLAAVVEISAAAAEIAVTLNPAVTIAGPSTFLGLTDTPNAYRANDFLRVTAGGGALAGLSAAQLVAALPAATATARGTIQLSGIPRSALSTALGTVAIPQPADPVRRLVINHQRAHTKRTISQNPGGWLLDYRAAQSNGTPGGTDNRFIVAEVGRAVVVAPADDNFPNQIVARATSNEYYLAPALRPATRPSSLPDPDARPIHPLACQGLTHRNEDAFSPSLKDILQRTTDSEPHSRKFR